MPKVTFIEHDGTVHLVEASTGVSLMRAAVDNGVPGIDADCGGECACGTCHVYIDPGWLERLPAQAQRETEMLSFAAATQSNSRLSCQVVLGDSLDGITVRLPLGQH